MDGWVYGGKRKVMRTISTWPSHFLLLAVQKALLSASGQGAKNKFEKNEGGGVGKNKFRKSGGNSEFRRHQYVFLTGELLSLCKNGFPVSPFTMETSFQVFPDFEPDWTLI